MKTRYCYVTSVLLVASCFLASPAPAQTTLSLTGGINLTSVAPETGLGPNYFPAKRPFTGVAVAVPVAGPLQLRLGAAFSQKGNSYFLDWLLFDDPDRPHVARSAPALDHALKMGYLEFTVLGSLASRVSGSPVTVHLLAGPAIGFLASCKATWTKYDKDGQPFETRTASCPDRPRVSYEPDEQLGDGEGNRLDFGLAAGTGLNVELTDRIGVTAEIVYTHGLTDAGDVWLGADPSHWNPLHPWSDLSARHRVLAVNAGVTYHIR